MGARGDALIPHGPMRLAARPVVARTAPWLASAMDEESDKLSRTSLFDVKGSSVKMLKWTTNIERRF
jgi:hypothetical protein